MPNVWLPTLRLYFRDFLVRLFFLTALCLAFFSALIIGWFGPRGSSVPLHYNVYFGIDLIGSALSLWWLPIMAICLILINGFVSLHVWRSDRVLSYFVAAGTLFCTTIILVSTVLTVLINRS